jgi:hypothetical protein
MRKRRTILDADDGQVWVDRARYVGLDHVTVISLPRSSGLEQEEQEQQQQQGQEQEAPIGLCVSRPPGQSNQH